MPRQDYTDIFETFFVTKFVTVEHTFEDEVELDEDEAEDDKDEASVVATTECKAPFGLL